MSYIVSFFYRRDRMRILYSFFLLKRNARIPSHQYKRSEIIILRKYCGTYRNWKPSLFRQGSPLLRLLYISLIDGRVSIINTVCNVKVFCLWGVLRRSHGLSNIQRLTTTEFCSSDWSIRNFVAHTFLACKRVFMDRGVTGRTLVKITLAERIDWYDCFQLN